MERGPGPIVESYEELAFEALKMHGSMDQPLTAEQIVEIAKTYNFRVHIDTRHVIFSADFIAQLSHSMRRSSNPRLCFQNAEGFSAPFRSVNDYGADTAGPWVIWHPGNDLSYAEYKCSFFDAGTRHGVKRGVTVFTRNSASLPEKRRLIAREPIACIELSAAALSLAVLGPNAGVEKVFIYENCIEFVNAQDETHRRGGPAIVERQSISFVEKGNLHRINGPAVVGEFIQYFLDGEEVLVEETSGIRIFAAAVLRSELRKNGGTLSTEDRAKLVASAAKADSLNNYQQELDVFHFLQAYVAEDATT